MATIRKKGEHQWHVQIRKRGWPTQTKTFNTKYDAMAWANVVESEMVRGVFQSRSEAEATTLAEALKRYQREITPHKKSERQENGFIRKWLADPLATRTLASLRGKDFADYRDKRRKAGMAESSVRLELALISHVFTVASKDWGMEGLANPVRSIRMPSSSRSRDRRLHAEELDAIIEASQSTELPTFLRLAVETVMRRSELLSLTWRQVDLNRSIAHLVDTKNGEARSVPLSSTAASILRSLTDDKDGKVFTSFKAPEAVTRAFQRALVRARKKYVEKCKTRHVKPNPHFLVNLRLHDLRHEGASRLFEKGFNPMEAAAVTGHKTLQMLKRYTHLKAEDLAKKLG